MDLLRIASRVVAGELVGDSHVPSSDDPVEHFGNYGLANLYDLPTGQYGSHDNLWLFEFGPYNTQVLVWQKSMDDALEVVAEWLEKNAPGIFTPPDYDAVRAELGPDASDEEVATKAEEDLTYTESGYIASYEWTATEVPKNNDLYRNCLEYCQQRYDEMEY